MYPNVEVILFFMLILHYCIDLRWSEQKMSGNYVSMLHKNIENIHSKICKNRILILSTLSCVGSVLMMKLV